MGHPRFSSAEITRRGQELYEQRIRPLVETDANIGKLISIDIETGDYEIADDLITTGDRLRVRHPGAALYGARIGYDAVYAIGSGELTRTAEHGSWF
jgi:hypothetical protein